MLYCRRKYNIVNVGMHLYNGFIDGNINNQYATKSRSYTMMRVKTAVSVLFPTKSNECNVET